MRHKIALTESCIENDYTIVNVSRYSSDNKTHDFKSVCSIYSVEFDYIDYFDPNSNEEKTYVCGYCTCEKCKEKHLLKRMLGNYIRCDPDYIIPFIRGLALESYIPNRKSVRAKKEWILVKKQKRKRKRRPLYFFGLFDTGFMNFFIKNYLIPMCKCNYKEEDTRDAAFYNHLFGL